MTLILRSALLALIATTGFAAPLAVPAEAQTTKIKLVLNWKYQGPQGMFFLAEDKGTSRPKALRSRSTRATAPAPRCRWLPTAPMTSASATSMR